MSEIATIAPCPFCGGACQWVFEGAITGDSSGRVHCGEQTKWLYVLGGCGYVSMIGDSVEVIRKHNALSAAPARAKRLAKVLHVYEVEDEPLHGLRKGIAAYLSYYEGPSGDAEMAETMRGFLAAIDALQPCDTDEG